VSKGDHIVEGKFQSDKYPWAARGFVPLKTTDPDARDLLWEYAQRRRRIDADFADDLERVLVEEGFQPPTSEVVAAAPTGRSEVLVLREGLDRIAEAIRETSAGALPKALSELSTGLLTLAERLAEYITHQWHSN